VSAIDELAVAVNQQHDLLTLLRQIARIACDLLGYESAGVLLVDDERTALRIRGSWGLTDAYLKLVNEDAPLLLAPEGIYGGSPSRLAFHDGTPVIIDDIANDPSYGPWAKAAEDHGHRSMAAVPLRNQGTTVGTINVYGNVPRQLGPSGLELLQILASHAGIALETSAQLERDSRRVAELSSLNETLRRQTELLQQHAAIHDRFIGVVRRGGGITDIAAALADTADRAVVVEDVSGKTMASVTHAGISVTPPDWQSWPQQADGRPRSLLDLIESAAPVVTSEWFRGLLAGPVRVGTETLGVLWLAGDVEEDGLHLRAIEQAAVVLGLELLRRRAVVDAQWQLRGDLVSELLSGSIAELDSVVGRGDRLGSDLRQPHCVLVVRPVEAGDAQTAELLRLVQSLALPRARPRPLLAMRDGAIVVIAPAKNVDDLANQIKTAGSRALGIGVRVAASEPAAELDRLPAAYRQAVGLLRLIRYRPGEPVHTVSSAGMVGMLLADVGVTRMGALAKRWIDPLRDYDQRRNTNLVATLRAYLDHDLNTNDAAATLYVHPNTVGLRIKRIETLLGLSLTNVDHLTTLRTALAIDDVTRIG
jgi:sugar diacid utilization regulator